MKKITGIIIAAQTAAIIMTGCAANAPQEEFAPPSAEETAILDKTETEAVEAPQETEPVTEAAESTEASEAAEPAETEAPDTEASDADTVILPDYKYNGTDEYMGVICDYLIAEEKARAVEPNGVYIPFGLIVQTDDTDPEDIIAYGTFNMDGYDLMNTTLFEKTGWRNYGAIHLRKNDDGTLEVTSADLPEIEEESKKVFDPVKGLYEKVIKEADSKLDGLHEEAVADYVNSNGLNITQWQEYGRAPKPVKGAPETREEDQFYKYASPLGYEITFDLREFDLSSDDEGDTFGAVEPDDKWTGTLMVVKKIVGDDTDAAIAKALSTTDATGIKGSDATVGNGIACKRAEYDEKLDDGRIFRYVCYAIPTDGNVLTVLIETTVEKGVSELSVEELEKKFDGTLQTLVVG